MTQVNKRAALFLAAAVAMALLSGCGGEKDINLDTYVDNLEPADQLYNQGLANLEKGRVVEASRKFDAVDRQHPYSEFARKSIVLGAFANYRQGRYPEAISAAKRYVTLYPTDKEAAYAQYIIGLSYFRQIPDVTRDQADSRRTVAAMTELVERYPDSEYVEDAKTKIRFARDQIAGKEMQVGRYYLERREYLGLDQAVPQCHRAVLQHPAHRRGFGAADGSLFRHGPCCRGADGGGGAGAEFPGQPLVQGQLQAASVRRA